MTDLRELLRGTDRILLTGHENPDGDCLGAETALFHLLRTLGNDPVICNPDPIGKAHDFLLRHTPFGHARGDAPLPPFDAVVLLDCAHLSRVGQLGERLRRAGKPIAVIDHHVGSEHGDGSVSLVDASAAATGALVWRLFREFGVSLNQAAAEGVFLSLVSDTGWFRYSNADAEVFAITSELVAAGVDASLVFDSLYRRNHRDSIGLLRDAMQRARLVLDGRLALLSLDRAWMDRAGAADFDTDIVMDPLRPVAGLGGVALL